LLHELEIALGLVFVIEGILYALAPNAMRRMLQRVLGQSEESIRITGIVAAGLGLVVIWLIQG
jgi:uncharacterized protein